jgi:glycosyltransferase involved in cell wall biosynthesis
MPKVSAIIIAKNEEGNIRACLESVSWADEIIVVDDESRDKTREIASRVANVKVLRHAMEHGYSAQKQFALEHASHEWVLSLDADERVSDESRQEIQNAMMSTTCEGFAFRRKNLVLGRFMYDRAAHNLRLFRREKGHFGGARVHEAVHVSGRIGVMSWPLVHYATSCRTIEDFLKSANAYSTLSAHDLFDRGRRVSLFTVPLYACAYPVYLFFRLYFFKWHWRDAWPGFVTSFFRALEGFFIYAKLWELQRGKR